MVALNRLRAGAAALSCLIALSSALPVHLQAQSTATRRAPAKQGIVDQVLALLQAKLPESIILQKIKSTNTPVEPTTDQLVKLKNAGATDAILAALSDPASGGSAAPASAPASATAAAPAASTASASPAGPGASSTPTATAIASPTNPPPAGEKKRVAVDEFDYSTVKTTVAAVFGTDQNIGKGIQAMFVKRIAQDGKVVVVERAKIAKIQSEQDLNGSNRVKQGTGARIGRIRGADALLYGDIVVFGRDDRKAAAKAGGLGSGIGLLPGGALLGGAYAAAQASRKTDKAVVVIDYRLVDAETSEVIATGEARGESSRKSNNIGALAGAFGVGGGGGQVDMTSSNFAETIIGEATMDCVNKLAKFMDEQVPNLQQKKVTIDARVAYVNGSTVTINAGSDQGVTLGDHLEVAHILNQVLDPTTKEVLDLATQKIGDLEITEVKDRVSIGTYRGTAGVKVGDVAGKK